MKTTNATYREEKVVSVGELVVISEGEKNKERERRVEGIRWPL